MTKTIYLASPYSHDDASVREERFECACIAAAGLMQRGHIVFSPVAHSHAVAKFLPHKLWLDHDFWMKQDMEILLNCTELVVLMIEGWEDSKGVKREIEEALAHNIPVTYLKWESYD